MPSPPSSPVSVPEYNTQFSPRPDDQETLWNVQKIIKEDRHRYLVKWDGVDPDTGKPWDLSWVPKHDCTDGLIHEWKVEKAKKAQKKSQKKRGSAKKPDPDYNPKHPKRRSVKSGSNSRSATASSNKPPSAGPSRLRNDSTQRTPKTTPIVEIKISKKRRWESTNQHSDGEGEAEEADSRKKKKRKLTTVSSDIVATPPPSNSIRRDGPHKKVLAPTQTSSQPNEDSYEVKAHRKVGKRPVVESSQESASDDGRPNDAAPREQSHDTASPEDDDPVERTSLDIDVKDHPTHRDLDLDPYEYDNAQMDDYDDGLLDLGDDVPQNANSEQRTPSPSRSLSLPSPRAVLRERGTIIPETQSATSSQAQPQPQPQPQNTKLTPAKPVSLPPSQHNGKGKGKSDSKSSKPDSSLGRGVSKPNSKSTSAPTRNTTAKRKGHPDFIPTISPSKPADARPLRAVPVMSPSKFAPFLTAVPASTSQLSSIDAFTSPSKPRRVGHVLAKSVRGDDIVNGKGKGNGNERGGSKRLAYSQRQEEEESESEAGSDSGSGSGSVEDDAIRLGNIPEEEDAIEDVDDVVIDRVLRQRGEELSRAEEERKRIERDRIPKPIKRPLSEVLSDHERRRSISSGVESEASERQHSDDEGVQRRMSRGATSSSSIDSVHRGVIKSSPISRHKQPSQWVTGRSSTATAEDIEDQEEGPAEAHGLVPEEDADKDLEDDDRDVDADAPVDELGPDDAPDAREQDPFVDSNTHPTLREINYSLEATGPWTQHTQSQRFFPRTIKSPTKQLDSALGLLHRKSEEIQELRGEVEVAQGRAVTLKRELETLRGRLSLAERKHGEVSAELDLERIQRRAEREVTAPGVDVAQNAELLEENKRLVQENEQLKAKTTRLESDVDMLRGLYAQASDAHQARYAENQALERDNKSLQVQAKTGVKQAGAFWEAQVRTLETELTRSKGTVKVLTDQAQRTGDDVRRRAALLPMVQQEVDDTRMEVEEWMEKVRELGRENTRLRVEVKDWEDDAMARRKRERERAERRAEEDAVKDELVWVCPWMDAEHRTKCAALLESREKLRQHFYEAGHL